MFQRSSVKINIMTSHPVRPVEVITKNLTCILPLGGLLISTELQRKRMPYMREKGTGLWIETMMARLPAMMFQRGIFFLPAEPCGRCLRPIVSLLGALFPLFAEKLLYAAQKKGVILVSSDALHTHAR